MAIRRKDNFTGGALKLLRNTAILSIAVRTTCLVGMAGAPGGMTWQGRRKGTAWAVQGEEPEESGRKAGSPVFPAPHRC